ncbi:MAG: dTMP kinase [Asgard group archaeon]|nr:dTMP kinase [Asgard group archaeon]
MDIVLTDISRLQLVKLKKGLFIALEGIDGTGKTTVANEIMKRLKKQCYSVVVYKEPTDETIAGKNIRNSYITERATLEMELQWFIEDREWDVNNRILPALAKNKIVILDRYFFSTACYQGVRKNGDWESILIINRAKFPEPDLTIIIDVDIDIAIQRITKSRAASNTFERRDYLKSVRALFLEMAKKDTIGNYVIIDGSQSLDTVIDYIYNVIKEKLTILKKH